MALHIHTFLVKIVLQLSEAGGAYRLISCPLETIHQLPLCLVGGLKNLPFHSVDFCFQKVKR